MANSLLDTLRDILISEPPSAQTFPARPPVQAQMTPLPPAGAQTFPAAPPAPPQPMTPLDPSKDAFMREQGARERELAAAMAQESPQNLAQMRTAYQSAQALRAKPELNKNPGFMSQLKNMFGDEERMTRLALAFNTMRMQPDQGLAAILGRRLETLGKNKRDSKTALVVAEKLEQMGHPDYAKIVRERPAMAGEVLKQIMQKKFKPGAGIKTSAVQIDPVTGQKYVVSTDPNNGEVSRVNISGAVGMTPQEKAALEEKSSIRRLDLKTAQEYGQKIFDQGQSLNSQIGRLETMEEALNDGATTGLIADLFPTMTATTAKLESAANSLGIDVINMATFGALSEKELELVRAINYPPGLSEDERIIWVKDKIKAQKKMRDELFRQAQTLMSGVTYSDWVTRFTGEALRQSAQEAQPQEQSPGAPVNPDDFREISVE